MSHENLAPNQIVPDNGMGLLPSVKDDQARSVIRGMVEGKANGHEDIKQKLAGISLVSFTRSGLLGLLTFRFDGDPERAKRFAYPEVFRKPLLYLDSPSVNDSLLLIWQQRETEIEDKIRARIQKKHREVLLGTGGEPVRKKHKGKRRKDKKRPVVYEAVSTQVRQMQEGIWRQESKDERNVFGQHIRRGETVCKLLGSYEVTPLLSALGRVGESGRVYYITNVPHLKEQLFTNISRVLVNPLNMKGEVSEKTGAAIGDELRKKIVKGGPLLQSLSDYLSLPFTEESFYFNDDSKQRESLYEKYPLVPIQHKLPYLPEAIQTGSVDVVVEMDRFSHISPENKEEMLREIDRILKPGGKLLIREGSRAQTEIEYYGEEILANYTRLGAYNLRHPARWMIFLKSKSDIHPNGNKPISNPQRATDEEIDGQIIEQIGARNQIENAFIRDLNAVQKEDNKPLSISWFKERGYLRLLVLRFGGDINQAVQYAVEQYKAREAERRYAESIKTPKDAKSFYTISDIAEELKTSPQSVRAILEKQIGAKISRHETRVGGASSAKTAPMHLSYAEYQIIKDIIESQKGKGGK